MKNLISNVLIKFFSSLVVIGAIIFIPAGTLNFWNGWLYLGTIFVLMTCALIYLFKYDRELLAKRMNTHERQKEQKLYVKLSIILLVVTFVVPGLDFRFGWSQIPFWVVMAGLVVVVLSYIMFLAVMMQNSYASRVIEIQHEQKLIDTGLYSVVRHPMYLSASIMYFATMIVLGSYYALIPMVLLPVLLAYRIIHEEELLIKGLPGYKEYIKKVKYRLIPFIW